MIRATGSILTAGLADSYVVIGTDARALGYYLSEQHPSPTQPAVSAGFQWIRPGLAADLLIIADSLSPTGREIR
jgi:hypothetical protein